MPKVSMFNHNPSLLASDSPTVSDIAFAAAVFIHSQPGSRRSLFCALLVQSVQNYCRAMGGPSRAPFSGTSDQGGGNRWNSFQVNQAAIKMTKKHKKIPNLLKVKIYQYLPKH